jgi:hypothetical protein
MSTPTPPQWRVMTAPDLNGKHYLALIVTTELTEHRFFLCMADDAEKTGNQFRKIIHEAGTDARRDQSGIVVANGNLGGLDAIRKTQGRK